MVDETTVATTPQESEAVTTVTDADLSSAFDAANEEQVTETTQTDTEKAEAQRVTEAEAQAAGQEQNEERQEDTEQHEEPPDNAERSRLGRRLKATEEKLDAILAKLGAPAGQTETAQPAAIPENVTYNDAFIQTEIDKAVEAGTLPETIMTPHDQYKVNQFVNGLQQYIGNQYAVRYLNTLKTPDLKGNTPDDIHAETVEELQKVESPFNLRRYDNPSLDAKMNYLEDKNAVLQKRLSVGTSTTVFKGKPHGVATGTSVSTRAATVTEDLPALDEASQDFIKRTGMSVDSVKNALKGSMPFNLRGGMR